MSQESVGGMRALRMVATGLVAGLMLAGCASAAPPSSSPASTQTIPSVKSFVVTPSPGHTGAVSGQIGAAQAPMQQLWAILDSGLRNDEPWPGRAAGQLPQDFADFATAVAQRCEPGLNTNQAQHLEQLRQAVIAQAARSGVDLQSVESTYFHAATQSCM